MKTVYFSIGNSDDKLSQAQWSDYCGEFEDLVRNWAHDVHGVWYSTSSSRYQNMCICAVLDDRTLDKTHDDQMRDLFVSEFVALKTKYHQKSIAMAVAGEAEML